MFDFDKVFMKQRYVNVLCLERDLTKINCLQFIFVKSRELFIFGLFRKIYNEKLSLKKAHFHEVIQ